MNEYYIFVFKDNTITTSKNLNQFVQIEYLKFVFKKTIYDEYIDYNKSKCYLYKYTHIDIKGNLSPIQFGKFEIIDIAPDERYGSTRKILLSENKGEKIHEINLNYPKSDAFIKYDLIPLIEILELTNSVDIYLKLKNISILEKEISFLKKIISNKDELIRQLRENCTDEKI